MKTHLVDNLRFLKMMKGVTNEDVMEAIGNRSFNNYLNGRITPPLSILIKLSDYFNVTLDELVLIDLKNTTVSKVEEEAQKYRPNDLEARVERLERMINKLINS